MNKLVPVYPWPMHASVSAALSALESEMDISVIEAVPGGPGPILAINTVPPFVTDAIVVRKPEHIAAAVRIVIGNGIELHTVRDTMGRYLGKDLGYEKIEKPGGPRFE